MTDLVERLRRACDPYEHCWRHERDKLGMEAAATIERQAALLREAREGLERIALGMVDGDPDSPHSMYMRARDLARTTLAKLENADV